MTLPATYSPNPKDTNAFALVGLICGRFRDMDPAATVAAVEATPEPAEGVRAGRAGVLDEAPWSVGHLRPVEPSVHLFRRHLGGRQTPIGTMTTPALAAQVVAEHRHAVEFRAMMRAAERFAERGLEGRRDDTAALAARLGFVPAAELAEAERHIERGNIENERAWRKVRTAEAERDSARDALAAANAAIDRVRAVADDIAGGPDRRSVIADKIRAALAAADGPPLPANTDPKAGDDG